MAIYSLNHRSIGKPTHSPGTAGAHIAYIVRKGAAGAVLAERMPQERHEARAWIDRAETNDRKNGRVCDKVMVALPRELDTEQRVALVRRFGHEATQGRGSWLAAIHDKGRDEGNPHAHFVIRDKDAETGIRVAGLSEKGSTERLRELWEGLANEALERGGHDARIDRRTLEAQGIERKPQIHVGPRAKAMQERGVEPVSKSRHDRRGRWIQYFWIDFDVVKRRGRTRAEHNALIVRRNERDAERRRRREAWQARERAEQEAEERKNREDHASEAEAREAIREFCSIKPARTQFALEARETAPTESSGDAEPKSDEKTGNRETGVTENRDNRDGEFGTDAEVREQLRSEIAGYLIAREAGMDYVPDQDRSRRCAQAELLREDPSEMFRASRDAETIKTWIMEPDARPELECQAKDRAAAEVEREKEAEVETGREMAGEGVPRHYLFVPYEEKNAARAAGARWDRVAKSWYAPEGADLGKLSAWDTVNGAAAEKELLSPQEEFGAACRNHGLIIKGEPIMDGEWHRVPVRGDKGRDTSGSYRGYLDGVPSGTITGFKGLGPVKWVARGRALTPEKREELEAEARQVKAGRAAERERGTEKAAITASRIFQSLDWARKETSPHLREKDIDAHEIKDSGKGGLVVPAQDVNGNMRSLQFIGADGSERMLTRGMRAGCMHMIDPNKELHRAPEKVSGSIVIAEGYATAASVHEATGRPVACAFDAHNLRPVAEALRRKYPDAKIVIASDDDRAKGCTVSLVNAADTAKAVGGTFVAPRFTEAEKAKGMTDYNDLARSRGRGAVREELAPVLGLEPKRNQERSVPSQDLGGPRRSLSRSQECDSGMEI